MAYCLCTQIIYFSRLQRSKSLFDRFLDVTKIISAENAPRILKEICENMKAEALLNSFSNFFMFVPAKLFDRVPACDVCRRHGFDFRLSRVTLFDDRQNLYIYTWVLSITRWKCGRFRILNRQGAMVEILLSISLHKRQNYEYLLLFSWLKRIKILARQRRHEAEHSFLLYGPNGNNIPLCCQN